MGFKLLTVLVAAALVNFCSPAIPPNIKLCPRSNPKMAECVKSSIEALKPYLKTGQIAPGFAVEPLDPLYVGDVAVQNGLNLKLMKMKAFGASNFKIEKIRVNVEKVKIEVLLSVPNIMVKAGYSLNWQVSLLNLQGKGEAFGYLDNVKILVRLTGSTYQKGGADYVKIDEVKVDIKPASLKVRFDNLFNGQKDLEDVGNEVINQNIAVIQNDVIPQVERGIERKFLQIVNQVFSRATAAEFFPQ